MSRVRASPVMAVMPKDTHGSTQFGSLPFEILDLPNRGVPRRAVWQVLGRAPARQVEVEFDADAAISIEHVVRMIDEPCPVTGP